MKILIITLNTYGGMNHYVSQLANVLSKIEDVIVIAPVGVDRKNFKKDVKIIELELGTKIKKFFINTLIFTRPVRFLSTIYKENPDIIHCNSSPMWLSFFLPFLIKYPIVTTIHDVRPHVGSRSFDQIIGKKMHIKFSDCLIVHGEKAKKEIGVNKKCYVIPHGDYSFFLNYKKNDVNEKENAILFFGRIEEYKGLEHLIRAVTYIVPEFPDINLIIAGGGDFSKYKNMILNDKNYEVHNRFIPDEEVPLFFQRVKVVVLPYLEGTQTGIIPIAYAFKKPVVVTDVGSIPEVVENGKTGFIVPSKDANALAEAILKLLKDDELRKEMGENAYRKMKEELSWDKIAEKTIEIYKAVINLKQNK
ncbi:MAG: glycosyltransferase family 4 protein [Candidatus Methanoperedens sp.]|nr:glycosyltransferase family 4 protein [Candidatus Methanoperedens sp.]